MPYCGRWGGPPSTKLSLLFNAYALNSLGKGIKRDQGTPHRHDRLCAGQGEENFSFVNESPRRLLSRRVGIEGTRRVAVVRLRQPYA
jgi:hypothetical protein